MIFFECKVVLTAVFLSRVLKEELYVVLIYSVILDSKTKLDNDDMIAPICRLKWVVFIFKFLEAIFCRNVVGRCMMHKAINTTTFDICFEAFFSCSDVAQIWKITITVTLSKIQFQHSIFDIRRCRHFIWATKNTRSKKCPFCCNATLPQCRHNPSY